MDAATGFNQLANIYGDARNPRVFIFGLKVLASGGHEHDSWLERHEVHRESVMGLFFIFNIDYPKSAALERLDNLVRRALGIDHCNVAVGKIEQAIEMHSSIWQSYANDFFDTDLQEHALDLVRALLVGT